MDAANYLYMRAKLEEDDIQYAKSGSERIALQNKAETYRKIAKELFEMA